MFLLDIAKYENISLDTETTGLRPYAGDHAYGIAISCPDNTDHYIDLRDDTYMTRNAQGMFLHKCPGAGAKLKAQLAAYNGNIIFHNESFDTRSCYVIGIKWPLARTHDTVTGQCLINEHEFTYELDVLAKKYTPYRKKGAELYERLAGLFGGKATKSAQIGNMVKAPPLLVGDYAMADSRATFALWQWQLIQIQKQALQQIVDFEDAVTPILIETEMRGIRVDIPAAEKAVGEISTIIKAKQKELNDLVGFKCNPQPSKDIKKLFAPEWIGGQWRAVDGTPLKETESGQPSIDAEALRCMSHPAAKLILELRNYLKIRDTFLVGHVLESSVGGRVYPTINQNKGEDGGTGTGRLSYVAPALQQIPDRNKIAAKAVKSVFLPDEGHTWIDCDKASFEVRIFAHLVGTPDIVEVYKKDPYTDFHRFVADETNLPRNATYNGEPNAKQINLSMIFNQGDGTTAEKLMMPWTWESFIAKDGKTVTYKKAGAEAAAIIERYHLKLPGVKKLARGCKEKAESRGYVFTRRGRHIRFPGGFKSYKASGLLIQSTAADENKASWIEIYKTTKELNNGSRLILNTHDSYSLSIPVGEEEMTARKVKESVEKDRGLRVPLILEVQRPGATWWESKSSKKWMV